MNAATAPSIREVVAALFQLSKETGERADTKLSRGLFLRAIWKGEARVLLLHRGDRNGAGPSDVEVWNFAREIPDAQTTHHFSSVFGPYVTLTEKIDTAQRLFDALGGI